MEGIEPDHRGTEVGGNLDEAPQIAEIADAPVHARAQQVELSRDAPDRAVALQPLGQVTPVGHDDQRHFHRRAPVSLYQEPVIAQGGRRLDDQQPALEGATRKDRRIIQIESWKDTPTVCHGAVLLHDPPGQLVAINGKHDRDREQAVRQAVDHHGRQRPRPLLALACCERRFRRCFAVSHDPHGCKKAALGGFGCFLPLIGRVLELRLDAKPLCQAVERAHSAPPSS